MGEKGEGVGRTVMKRGGCLNGGGRKEEKD